MRALRRVILASSCNKNKKEANIEVVQFETEWQYYVAVELTDLTKMADARSRGREEDKDANSWAILIIWGRPGAKAELNRVE